MRLMPRPQAILIRLIRLELYQNEFSAYICYGEVINSLHLKNAYTMQYVILASYIYKASLMVNLRGYMIWYTHVSLHGFLW